MGVVEADSTVLGQIVEEFRPRTWAKWLTIAIFAPLALAGLVVGIGIPIAILVLPGVPLAMALPVAAVGLIFGCLSVWFVLRSWKWLGHRLEVRRGGIVRRWRRHAEAHPWSDIREVEEMSIRFKGREHPRIVVRFLEGKPWEIDEEYPDFARLRERIVAQGAE